jgi:hypothetical protein
MAPARQPLDLTMVSFRLPKPLLDGLREQADMEKVSVTEVVRRLLSDGLMGGPFLIELGLLRREYALLRREFTRLRRDLKGKNP